MDPRQPPCEAATDDTSPSPRRGRSRSASRLRRLRGPLAVVLLVGVILATVAVRYLPDAPAPADPLDEMAQVAANPPVQAQPSGDRPVLHLIYEVTATGGNGAPGTDSDTTEIWHAWRRRDGSGREDRGGRPRLIDPASGIIRPHEARGAAPPPAGTAPVRPRDDGTTGSFDATIGGVPINQSLIDELPRTPSALRAKLIDLVSGLAPDGPTERDTLVFQGATDLLVSWLAPPDLRSAALEVVGDLEGVSVRAGRDSRGRGAVIVTLRHEGIREVSIDPSTSAVTGHRVTDADGNLVWELRLVAADWVAAVPQA